MGDFNEIARSFVTFYYNAFDADRNQLKALYRDASMLTYENSQFMGVANISQKLASLPFQRIKHIITTLDAQPSHPTSGSILITVMGQVFIDDEPNPLNFLQTFHLYPEGNGQYFVFNDIFRLVMH